MTEEELITTAKTIRELFPKGIKPGTDKPWRISYIAVIDRLKKLEKRFNIQLDSQEIIQATKRYISVMQDSRYMKTLEYFIYKQYIVDGKIEIKSDLLTFIEMIEDGDVETTDNWTTHLK